MASLTPAEQAAEGARIDEMNRLDAERDAEQFWRDSYQTALVASMHRKDGASPSASLSSVSEDARILANVAVANLEGFRIARKAKSDG